MSNASHYNQRGVSSRKEDVHHAIQELDRGLFPNAFCKVLPDILGGDEDYCNVMHADGAGTKSALAYIYWKETGDYSVWKGIAHDALIMNIDDLICVGATDNILMSSTIGRNKHKIPGDVLMNILKGFDETIQELARWGVRVYLTGGETADIGDLVRTIIVDSTVACRMKRSDVIENRIMPGDVIVGLASSGKASYEKEYNSGIGSNGLTSARHDVFIHYLAESIRNRTMISSPNHLSIQANTSLPRNRKTWTWMPANWYCPLHGLLPRLSERYWINSGLIFDGMIHCTGGGQTKVLKFIDDLHVIKDNLFELPPLFGIIQQSSGTPWEEMYEVFNMGHRFEIYTDAVRCREIIRSGRRNEH